MSKSITVKRKIGFNRGDQRRIWLEGKTLLNFGWTRGTTYERKVNGKGWILVRSSKATLKVAGSETRPVIDICGKYVGQVAEGCDHALVTITKKQIFITTE